MRIGDTKYIIYAEGTMSQDGRTNALYQRKNGAPAYTYGAYADRFDKAEADRRTAYKGKYKWIARPVSDAEMIADYNRAAQENKLTSYSLAFRNKLRSTPEKAKSILFEAHAAYDNVVEDTDEDDKKQVRQSADKHWNDLQKFAESLKVSTKDKLIQSSSEKAFNENVATEIKAGKDPKQAVAIAYSVKRENDSTSLSDMALSRTDAMDRAISLGKQFIKHFDKIYKNPKDNSVEHWKSEMRTWFGDVRSIKLKSNHQPLLNSEIHDWFLTAGAEAQDFMKNPTQEEINAYDKFATEVLSSGINAALNNKEHFNIHDNISIEENDGMIKDGKYKFNLKPGSVVKEGNTTYIIESIDSNDLAIIKYADGRKYKKDMYDIIDELQNSPRHSLVHDKEDKNSMIKDAKFLVNARKDGKLLEEQVVGTRLEAEKLAEQFEKKYGEYTTTIKVVYDSRDSIGDASPAFDGFAYMIKQYSSRPEQLTTIAAKIKAANDLTSQEKQELLSRIEAVKDSSIKDAPPVDVLGIVQSKRDNTGKTWYLLSISTQSGNRGYLVTGEYDGGFHHSGGGSVSFNLNTAKADLDAFITLANLKAKYGEAEGYKRYMAGHKDSAPVKVIAKKALEMQDGCSRHYLEVEDCDGKRFYMVTDEYDGCSKQFSGSGSVIEDKATLSKKYKDDLASGLRSVGQSAMAGAKAVKRKLSGEDEAAIDSKMYATPLDNLIKCGQVKDGVSASKVDAMLGINNVEATKQLLRDANIKYSPVTAKVSEYRIVDGKCVKVDEQ